MDRRDLFDKIVYPSREISEMQSDKPFESPEPLALDDGLSVSPDYQAALDCFRNAWRARHVEIVPPPKATSPFAIAGGLLSVVVVLAFLPIVRLFPEAAVKILAASLGIVVLLLIVWVVRSVSYFRNIFKRRSQIAKAIRVEQDQAALAAAKDPWIMQALPRYRLYQFLGWLPLAVLLAVTLHLKLSIGELEIDGSEIQLGWVKSFLGSSWVFILTWAAFVFGFIRAWTLSLEIDIVKRAAAIRRGRDRMNAFSERARYRASLR